MRTVALVMVLIMPLPALGDDPGMSPSIQEIKKQNEKRLLNMPGVVSVGIGLNANGDQAIIVGLDAPNPETETRIPDMLEGFPVVVQAVGPLKAR